VYTYVTFSNQYVTIKDFHFTFHLALMSDSSFFPYAYWHASYWQASYSCFI